MCQFWVVNWYLLHFMIINIKKGKRFLVYMFLRKFIKFNSSNFVQLLIRDFSAEVLTTIIFKTKILLYFILIMNKGSSNFNFKIFIWKCFGIVYLLHNIERIWSSFSFEKHWQLVIRKVRSFKSTFLKKLINYIFCMHIF